MAYPAHEPTDKTRNQVKLLGVTGSPQKLIAAVMGISLPTLKKHYGDTLRTCKTELNARVVEFLYAHCKTSPAACMFWLKTQAGWRETAPEEGREPRNVNFRVTMKGERLAKVEPEEGDE